METLFWIKGIVALTALALHIWHMSHTPRPLRLVVKLRFVAMMSAAGLIAFASQDQISSPPDWSMLHSLSLAVASVLLTAAVAGLWEDRHHLLPPTKGHF